MMKPYITTFNNFFLKSCILFCCFSNLEVLPAQVGIGTNAPEASAVLDLSSTHQGFLPPRMTLAEMKAIASPAEGLLLYCTDCAPQGLYYFDGSYFLNSNRGAVSGNLDSFVGNTIVHNGGVIYTNLRYGPSDGITTSIDVKGWSGRTHNPISFRSTVHLGYTATLVSFDVANGVLEGNSISDSQLTASTEFSNNHAAIYGRLNSTVNNNWAAGTIDQSQWFQVDLGQIETVLGVATQGGHNATQWITSYIIQYSNDGINFTDYNGGAILTANTDRNTVIRNDFSPAFNARYVRFNPQTWQGHITGRFDIFIDTISDANATFQIVGESGIVSNTSLEPTFKVSIGGQSLTFSRTTYTPVLVAAGLESGTLPNSQLTASTEFSNNHAAIYGRLNSTVNNNWAVGTIDQSQWFEVDLGQIEMVSGVATQGGHNADQWITSYIVQYSNDGINFTDYNGGAILTANTDRNTIIRNDFSPTFNARYVRFNPQTWQGHITGRFEVYILR